MFIDDANVFAKLSIKLIRDYQHIIYRLSISNDKSDLLYAESVEELNVAKIIDFLYNFKYDKFNNLPESEKEIIFNELMTLHKDLIYDSDKLRIKYIKHFKE